MHPAHSPRPPQETLPTMYDLPSEDPEEPGLPDEFHAFQPQLLRETFQPASYPLDQVFIGTDINLYYESRHPLWHKRPDWFVCLGVAAAARQEELRWSYVIWQEGVAPFLVLELLSPGTEAEDLGQTLREVSQPPTKWEVYERILRIPYYVIFDRYTNQLRAFSLLPTRYREIDLPDQRLWFEEVELGLGIWQGRYQGAEGHWLRWYDTAGRWIATPSERAEQAQQQAEQVQQQVEQAQQQAEQAQQQAEQERQRAERLAEQLRALGIDPS
ncbi:Uma2 family endonuclease [Sphaerothrix gracilis]|uniref:Uma2 family endonuclease n=1 Tax=Sphaerothrix gracilis TaxID=3151835 RepID=UPI0031FBB673